MTAPLFLKKDQDFVWAPDLKADLARLDAHFSKLPEKVKERGIFALATYPQRKANSSPRTSGTGSYRLGVNLTTGKYLGRRRQTQISSRSSMRWTVLRRRIIRSQLKRRISSSTSGWFRFRWASGEFSRPRLKGRTKRGDTQFSSFVFRSPEQKMFHVKHSYLDPKKQPLFRRMRRNWAAHQKTKRPDVSTSGPSN